ncbi:fimbrillin family protein [Parabacteroides sp.]
MTASARVPIRLYTAIQTRALVDAFDNTPVNIAAGSGKGLYTESWAARATTGEIVLDPERYYPADGSPVFLRGYYPPAPLENGKVHYTLTGQEDLMLSVEQSGTLAERFDAVRSPLVYSHLLTQLNFKIKLNGAPDTYKLRSLTLDGLAAGAQVDLFAGTIEPVGKAEPLIIYIDNGTGGFPITDGVLSLPGYVLVQPNAELTMDLVLNIDGNPAHDLVFNDIPVRFTDGSEGGNAYVVEIDLTIPETPDKPDVPDTPDEPDDPNPPVDPDVPDVPDVPDPPTPPVKPEDITVTITARVTEWNKGQDGSIEIPDNK